MANDKIRMRRKDLICLSSAGSVMGILAGVMPDEDKKEAQALLELTMTLLAEADRDQCEPETDILKETYVQKVEGCIQRINNLIAKRREALQADTEHPHAYEQALLDFTEKTTQLTQNGTAPEDTNRTSGGAWIMFTMVPQLKAMESPQELQELEQQHETTLMVNVINNAVENMQLDADYKLYKLGGNETLDREQQFRDRMNEADNKTRNVVNELRDPLFSHMNAMLANVKVENLGKFFGTRDYLQNPDNGFQGRRGLGEFEVKLAQGRHYQPNRTIQLIAPMHDEMKEYFDALPSEEEKLDFLLGLQHMSNSEQLRKIEADMLQKLTSDFFYPKDGEGNLGMDDFLRRHRLLIEAEERVKAQLSNQVWQTLTEEEKQEVRKYNETLEETRKRNPDADLPFFPPSVREKYWAVRHGSYQAVLQTFEDLKGNLREMALEQETDTVRRAYGVDNIFDMGTQANSMFTDQAAERVKQEVRAYKPELLEGYSQLGGLTKQFGSHDQYLRNKYPQEGYDRNPQIEKALGQITEEANARLDMRWTKGEMPPQPPAKRVSFLNNEIDKAKEANYQSERDRALSDNRSLQRQRQEYRGNDNAENLVREYLRCDTPDERAAFVNTIFILKDANLLNEKEVAATELIIDNFVSPIDMDTNKYTAEKEKTCVENLKAFRRLMDGTARRVGALAETYENEIIGLMDLDDRKAKAENFVLHHTTDGALLDAQRRFLSGAMKRLPKQFALKMQGEIRDVDHQVRIEKGLTVDGFEKMNRGLQIQPLSEEQLGGADNLRAEQMYQRNQLKCVAAAYYQPTWRSGDKEWTFERTSQFRAEALSKLENPGARAISDDMLSDLAKLADEIKDADRFFYINGEAYKNLRDSLRTLVTTAREQKEANTLNTEQGRIALKPLITAVDRACGDYILSHSDNRHSRHGNRRFNVALLTNALLNPAAAEKYSAVIETIRDNKTINYQKLAADLNLKTKVNHPRQRQANNNGQAVRQNQNRGPGNQM
ncbi:MAG: hypothetical protein IJT34_07970 [Butyrivibrio sp.]|nr:hypothetical protein [Butyrivibrio sp.]